MRISSYIIYFLFITAGLGVYAQIETDPLQRTVWLHGSANVVHDQLLADSIVGAEVRFGLWCSSDTADSKVGDVLFSSRADSYIGCNWSNQAGLGLIGGGNYEEFVGDEEEEGVIFISNGGAYGNKVDFFVGEPNQGDAVARAANWLLTQAPITASQLRQRLTGEPMYVDDRYVGIKAKELQPPPPPPDVSFLPGAVYGLLLLDD